MRCYKWYIKTECSEMGLISSLQDCKMRVLILSCILASVAAAPSNIIAPILKSEVIAPVAAVPVIAPVPVAKLATVDPGDVEAEAINAKVAAEDAAIAAADKARLLSELAVEDAKDKTQVVADQVNEKNGEAFWSVEDQKWRYLDAVNTAEAKLDGAIARDATILAKSTLGGLIVAPAAPILAPHGPLVAPILAPRAPLVAPIVYSAAPILKSYEKKDDKKDEKMDEKMKMSEKMEDKIGEKINEKWETIIKSAEMINEDLKNQVAALEKNLEAKPAIFSPTLFSAPIAAPYKLTEPWHTQVYVPGAAYSAYNALHALPSPLLPSAVKLA